MQIYGGIKQLILRFGPGFVRFAMSGIGLFGTKSVGGADRADQTGQLRHSMRRATGHRIRCHR
jgi:hypothetical protein